MKKPIIGIASLSDYEEKIILMLPSYMSAVVEAGGIPVILPIMDEKEDIKKMVDKFDGFILTGGQDVNPKIYNEEKKTYCENVNKYRDYMEQILIEEVLNNDKPLLAICRGFQLLNVHLGGSLYQDIKVDKNNGNDSIHRQAKPYNRPSHKVNVNTESLLFNITNKEELMINSMHHQAIKKLSPKLTEAAVSEDGIIESIYMDNKKFVLGVQWHPELLYKEYKEQLNIFNEFISNCNK